MGRLSMTTRPQHRKSLTLCLLAVLAAAVSAGCGAGQPAKPKAPTAHQREIAAVASWVHGDGDQLYQQFTAAMKAWTNDPTGANAITWWQTAGISLGEPPPVGTVQWEAAMRDWEKAAQLAGGDPGAPTGGPRRILRYVRAGNTHMAKANAEIRPS
jgi:hypothetical protein